MHLSGAIKRYLSNVNSEVLVPARVQIVVNDARLGQPVLARVQSDVGVRLVLLVDEERSVRVGQVLSRQDGHLQRAVQ